MIARYTKTAVVLHWTIAVIVVGQFAWGWLMQEIPKSPPGLRADAFNFHKSIGLCLLALMLFRLGWRIAHSPPPFACAAGVASETCDDGAHRAVRRADRDAARRVSRVGVERLSDQVVRCGAAGMGEQGAGAQGGDECRPRGSELVAAGNGRLARRRRCASRFSRRWHHTAYGACMANVSPHRIRRADGRLNAAPSSKSRE